jgi:hypothetical protein
MNDILKRALGALFAVTLAGTMVACGGDDDKDATAAEEEARDADEDTSADEGDADAAGDEADEDADADEADDADSDGGEGRPTMNGPKKDTPFCRTVLAVDEKMDELDLGDTAESAAEAFKEVSKLMGAIDPPSEIEGDWKMVVSAFSDLAEAYADIDLTKPDAMQVLDERNAELEARYPDMDAASDRIDDYLTNQCGLQD